MGLFLMRRAGENPGNNRGTDSRQGWSMHQRKLKHGVPTTLVSCLLGLFAGCHKPPPPVTSADVAVAQQEAQHEVEQAKAEAKKDVKSAAKISGSDSRDVALAKVTGSFDIAMARADGDHKVALENCLTLPPAAQPPCKQTADADYQAAVDKAKTLRAAQRP
jgi:hypothetical protein